MQTQIAPKLNIENNSPSNDQGTSHAARNETFPVGTVVAYALQGLCTVQAIETRSAGGQNLEFYKLEKLKSPLSRSQKVEASIWVPIRDARSKGLRLPATPSEIDNGLALLANSDVFFPLDANWSDIQPTLEAAIRTEGFLGLCKVFSYLKLLERRKILLNTETARFSETVSRHFYRELGQTLNEGIRELEQRVNKNLRHKISATH